MTRQTPAILRALGLAGALAAAAAPVRAQEPPKPQPAPAATPQPAPAPSGNDEIVVEGENERDRARQIRDYAKALTSVDSSSAIALYQPEDYCPAAVGLSAPVNAAIAARMRQVAAAANVGVAGEPCPTSALVLFVEDGEAAMTEFRARHVEYFTGITGEEIAYQGQGTPAIAWKIVARLDRNGNPVAVDPTTGIQMVESALGGSRLEATSTLVIAMSVLVIEKQAVRGLTTQQIADYALMRSVSEVDPARLADQRAQTIVKVLDAGMGEETPLSLTAWDLAYVKARYSVNRVNLGVRQLSDIRARMRRGLETAATGAQ